MIKMNRAIAVCKCNQHVFDMEHFLNHSVTVDKYPILHEWMFVEDLLLTEEVGFKPRTDV